jgi:hypothetical protein
MVAKSGELVWVLGRIDCQLVEQLFQFMKKGQND